MRSYFHRFGILAGAAVVACGNGASTASTTVSQTASQTEAVVLTPDGGGPPGSLVVQLPAGLANPPQYIDASVFPLGGPTALAPARAIKVGTSVDLAPGVYCVGVRSWRWDPGSASVDCSVHIDPATTTTYTLSSLQVTFDVEMLKTAFGPRISASVTISKSNAPAPAISIAGPWTAPFDTQSQPILVTAGEYDAFALAPSPDAYSYRYDIPLTGATMLVGQGEIVNWNVTIPEWRFRIHIVPPSRTLPNAPFSMSATGVPNQVSIAYFLTAPVYPDVIEETHFDAPATDLVLGVPPAANRPLNYTLRIYGVPMIIPGGAPASQVDVKPGRIDVADAPFTTRDGTPVSIPGTWKATRHGGGPGPDGPWSVTGTGSGPLNSAATVFAPPFKTNLGVDVIPGTYDVTVQWDQSAYGGTPQTETFQVTF
jgi:hypothetical protein